MSKKDTFQDITLRRKVLYSGLSGAIATTCIYPIDITKTKLMDQKGMGTSRLYSGPLDCMKKIIQTDGLKGLYRGWPPNVLFVMPEKAIKLTMNDYLRSYFRSRRPKKDLPLSLEMAAGGLAGFCQVIMTNPMELLKIQGATIAEKIKSGERTEKIQYIKLTKELGISGLYTGVISTLLRDVPFSMIYFSMYAQTNTFLQSNADPNDKGAVAIRAFAAGAIAGTTAAAITTPLDVVKTRVHSAAKPIRLSPAEYFSREFRLVADQFVNIATKEGASAFIKGIVPRCFIISPLFAITMACYEKFQVTFGNG